MKSLRFFVMVLLLGLATCKKQSSNDRTSSDINQNEQSGEDQFYDPGEQVSAPEQDRSDVRKGSLYILEDGVVKGGIVNYEIHKDGKIIYDGEIRYLGNKVTADLKLPEFSQNFKGEYKADAKSVLAETFKQKDKVHKDYKVQFKVAEITSDDPLAVARLEAVVDNSETIGVLEIDISGPIIEIISAEIKGKALGADIVLKLSSYMP